MEELTTRILESRLPTRTVVPDVRCICGKVILMSARKDYLSLEPGNIGKSKEFMARNGINRVCCMNSLFNETNFPKLLPQGPGFKEQTLADQKLNSRLITINKIFSEWKKGVDVLKMLDDFYEDELMLYDPEPDLSVSFQDRYSIAKENKDILSIIEILKEYAFFLGKNGGLSKLSTLKIDLSDLAKVYKTEKILSIAKKF